MKLISNLPRFLTRAQSAVLFAALIGTAGAYAQVTAPGHYYVSADRTDERLEPKASGKSTNILWKRQALDVLEVKGEWARVTKYYDGEVEGVKGQVARWVRIRDLSAKRPPDEVAKSTEPAIAKVLVDSDDFAKYRTVFIAASQKLVDQGRCTVQDFKDGGGWSKSSNFAGAPVYFAYCGGMTKANRLYLNVQTGAVTR